MHNAYFSTGLWNTFKLEIAERVKARWLPAVVPVILLAVWWFLMPSKMDSAPGYETAPNPHLPSCASGQSPPTHFLLSVAQPRGHFVWSDHPSVFSTRPVFHPVSLLSPSVCFSRCLRLLLSCIHRLITLLSHSDLSIQPSPPFAPQLVCVTECSASAFSLWQLVRPGGGEDSEAVEGRDERGREKQTIIPPGLFLGALSVSSL